MTIANGNSFGNGASMAAARVEKDTERETGLIAALRSATERKL